jgi:RNA polymerase sigma-70 factor, ECF subfamily
MNELEADYERLYTWTLPRLVGQLTVITGSQQEAQDAVQEAFFRAWSRWARVSQYEDPEGWVRRVAINAATSSWRKLKRMVPMPMPRERDGASVGGGVDQAAMALDLLATIKQVPRREREALVLFYVADLSIQGVADSMGIRPGSAKALLSRGRQRLHALLSEADVKGRHNDG